MKQPLLFSKKVLFLEFFIREYSYFGKGDKRSNLPKDAQFYIGASKAGAYKQKTTSPILGFDNGQPYLSECITKELKEKIFNKNTNIVALITSETLDENNTWWKQPAKLISNKTGQDGNKGQFPYHNFQSIAPYNFNILSVNPLGIVETDFPRKNQPLFINVGETLCFLCRKQEWGYGEWYFPNTNLILFVKNYGLFESLNICPEQDIIRIAERNLSTENFKVRDFRKSSHLFNFG